MSIGSEGPRTAWDYTSKKLTWTPKFTFMNANPFPTLVIFRVHTILSSQAHRHLLKLHDTKLSPTLLIGGCHGAWICGSKCQSILIDCTIFVPNNIQRSLPKIYKNPVNRVRNCIVYSFTGDFFRQQYHGLFRLMVIFSHHRGCIKHHKTMCINCSAHHPPLQYPPGAPFLFQYLDKG